MTMVYAVQLPDENKKYPVPDDTGIWKYSPKPYACPICSGKGVVKKGFYPGNTNTDKKYVECRACKGKGIIFS